MAKVMLHSLEPAVFKASEFWTLIASVYVLTLMSCVTMQGCSKESQNQISSTFRTKTKKIFTLAKCLDTNSQ